MRTVTALALAVLLIAPGAIGCVEATDERGSDSGGSAAGAAGSGGAGSGGAGSSGIGGAGPGGDGASGQGSEPLPDGGTAGAQPAAGSGGSDTGAAGGTAGGTGGSQAGSGGGGCVDVSGVDYGLCRMLIGWGFDGEKCRSFGGCDCEPNCDHFYDDAISCATACAANGGCDLSLMKRDLAPDQMCDTVFVCVEPTASDAFSGILPGVSCPGDGGWSCTDAATCDTAYGHYYITDEQWTEICALSLLPEVRELVCMVWL